MAKRSAFLIAAVATLGLGSGVSAAAQSVDCPTDISRGRTIVDTSKQGGGILQCVQAGIAISKQQGSSFMLCKGYMDNEGFQTAYSLNFRNGELTSKNFCLIPPRL